MRTHLGQRCWKCSYRTLQAQELFIFRMGLACLAQLQSPWKVRNRQLCYKPLDLFPPFLISRMNLKSIVLCCIPLISSSSGRLVSMNASYSLRYVDVQIWTNESSLTIFLSWASLVCNRQALGIWHSPCPGCLSEAQRLRMERTLSTFSS